MARRKRRSVKKRRTKTLTQRVTALEKAIAPIRGKGRGKGGRKLRVVATPSDNRAFTPPHLARQLGL